MANYPAITDLKISQFGNSNCCYYVHIANYLSVVGPSFYGYYIMSILRQTDL